MQKAVPSLIERRGNVVNVSSVTGLRAFPGVLAYCVSKAGVDQLTRCAALELASKGVRVNAVNPGVVVTEIHRRGGMTDEQYAVFSGALKTNSSARQSRTSRMRLPSWFSFLRPIALPGSPAQPTRLMAGGPKPAPDKARSVLATLLHARTKDWPLKRESGYTLPLVATSNVNV